MRRKLNPYATRIAKLTITLCELVTPSLTPHAITALKNAAIHNFIVNDVEVLHDGMLKDRVKYR